MNYLCRLFSSTKKNICKLSNKSVSLRSRNESYFRFGDLVHNEDKGAFYLPIENEAEYAVILYKRRNGTLELYETLVPEHLRGYGIGQNVAKEVFEYISVNKLKVILTCDFLQRFYEENPYYEDIVIDEDV